jgi:hypothetical protein
MSQMLMWTLPLGSVYCADEPGPAPGGSEGPRRGTIGQRDARQELAGSSSQGISYLVERDSFLFHSPIRWYVQQNRWDLSPGYEKENPPLRPARGLHVPVLPTPNLEV